MANNILSIEGNIVNIDQTRRGRIEIDKISGLITKVGETTGFADLIFNDELIFPGFIDLHVHAREDVSHRDDYKEDFKTAGEAAINGGVVTYAEMPNNPSPPIDEESYKIKNELTKKSPVPVLLYAAIGNGTKPIKKEIPYKVFMGPSIGSLFFHSFEDLEKVLSQYRGCSVSFHCEDPEILEKNKNERDHESRRPKEAEIRAIDFALLMIEKYNLQGKICHCSTKEGIEKIKNAKIKKINIMAEVSPHHLYFDSQMITEDNHKWMQMNPPLRSKEDKLFLIKELLSGTIDFLATDHAPHTKEEKMKGISGTPQLDTYSSFASWLMKEHNFSPQDIMRVCSYNPGNFINRFTKEKYGQISPGFAGSLSILDLNKPVKITNDIIKSKCAWSPFLGITFPGRAVTTIIKGKVYKI